MGKIIDFVVNGYNLGDLYFCFLGYVSLFDIL